MMDDDDELDRLAQELNDWRPGTPTGGSGRLDGWLAILVGRGGSDLFLVSGRPPSIRVRGEIVSLGGGPLDGPEIEEAILPELSAPLAKRYLADGAADMALRRPSLGRFRLNLHHERGRAAACIRALPAAPPILQDLHLPANVEQLTRLPHGLVLIGGPTGSGKTTTLAALVDHINRRDARHIITIEDPIEFEHPHRRSLIEQIEVGIDTPDFPTALRASLRQAPDVIVIGEMRDPETMRIALAAGETGHLVFATLHTNDVSSTVSRVADSFPPERQATIRQELSMSLAAVLTQVLLPRLGGGLVPAAELLMIGYGARQHIRKDALQHLHQEITITRKAGSFTLEESLADLVKRGVLDAGDARSHTIHLDELNGLLGAAGASA